METITQKMQQDHRHCDELFLRAEELIADEKWDKGLDAFKDFYQALIHHLNMEEQVLFPEFEKATGSSAGPTQVMRSEHEQMRDLLSNMAKAVEQHNQDDYLGLSETLLIMMQQHNAKEENILYPLTDQALARLLPDLLDEMDRIDHEQLISSRMIQDREKLVIDFAGNNPYLDVSELEPPEPMTMVLDTLPTLQAGQFLHVYHRREPFPLYTLLQDMHMKWRTVVDNNGMYHIYIWSEGDAAAESKATTQ